MAIIKRRDLNRAVGYGTKEVGKQLVSASLANGSIVEEKRVTVVKSRWNAAARHFCAPLA